MKNQSNHLSSPADNMESSGTDQTVTFKINTAAFLNEIAENALMKGMGVLHKPLNIFRSYLVMIGDRCAEINDPVLNHLMCQMAIYSAGDPYSPEYDKEACIEAERVYWEFMKKKGAAAPTSVSSNDMKHITGKELKSGKVFRFSNAHLNQDDVRKAEAFWSETLKKFVIIFNGAFVHTSITANLLRSKLQNLCTKWNLKEIPNTQI